MTTTTMRSIGRTLFGTALAALAAAGTGCATRTPPYGREVVAVLPGSRPQVWAVAPAINLSGQREVDALLQSDVLYHKLQEVRGLTVVPVDRVVQVYAALRIEQVQSPEQAAIVCEALGADALVVPTVTAYDPYDPPKWGGSLQMFRAAHSGGPPPIDVRDLVRNAAPDPAAMPAGPTDAGFVQAVGMFDAANGTIRDALMGYARGRHDPVGPMGPREYLLSMDRYVGFAYHTLVGDLLRAEARAQARTGGPRTASAGGAAKGAS
ncbi:MAG: hypothetical protein AVDCRST_MAG64-1736 [uncultured Phycisphaerae bacterium]|uniref:Uncharacterized protein n=1 Tax=uncultured Phycisphaerae bacterium TaxID=904963 RepID=A0A6J4P6N2_9BACT|nr:MAG: hypothetical protein AVDCRST_MAG64-1736 [uncultured Phycisphaerae bacterium]